MRYVIRAESSEAYQKILMLIRREGRVLTELPRRNAISAEIESAAILGRITRIGGTIACRRVLGNAA